MGKCQIDGNQTTNQKLVQPHKKRTEIFEPAFKRFVDLPGAREQMATSMVAPGTSSGRSFTGPHIPLVKLKKSIWILRISKMVGFLQNRATPINIIHL